MLQYIKTPDPKIKPEKSFHVLLISSYTIELSYKVTLNLMADKKKEVFNYKKVENMFDYVNCRICI